MASIGERDLANLDSPILGASISQVVDATPRLLTMTSTAMGEEYPFRVELEAVGEDTYVSEQGDASVTLGIVKAQIADGNFRVITITSADDAHVQISRAATGSGTLVATVIGRAA